ncbi:galactokinase [Natronospora cellulosivora (SeqCode)]
MNIEELWQIYNSKFEDTGLKKGVFAAPGRVNLIGEHTDYNDGFVLPMAIEKDIRMAIQLREDQVVRAYSLDYEKEVLFSLLDLEFEEENMWINYIKGVIDELQKEDFELSGFNLIFTGNVPQGSGLSSSAALEVVTAYALAKLHDINIKAVEMALLSQRAENNFVGVNCGIMDQYISRLGKEDHALMIDCRSNEYELIPFKSDDYKILISNSKVSRGLVDSEYNQRREECEAAVSFFQDKLDHNIKALRDISIEEYDKYASDLPELVAKRAKHVISENNRVLTASAALKNNDFDTFGKLMTESHRSLEEDYQVSCKELDLLVDLALKQKGVLGSRMTGAGFGGCTVTLIEEKYLDQFIANVSNEYQEETGISPDIYISSPANGARKIKYD